MMLVLAKSMTQPEQRLTLTATKGQLQKKFVETWEPLDEVMLMEYPIAVRGEKVTIFTDTRPVAWVYKGKPNVMRMYDALMLTAIPTEDDIGDQPLTEKDIGAPVPWM